MTWTVWKYTLNREDEAITKITLPIEAEPLHVDVQDGEVRLWVLVNPEYQGTEVRTFQIVGTGHVMKRRPLEHIHTFMVQADPMVGVLMGIASFVFHVFEVETDGQ